MVSSDQLGLDEKVEDVRTQADMGASTLLLSQTAVSSRGFPSTILRTRRTTAKRTPNAYKRGDEEDLNRSPNTKTTATTLSSVAPSEAEDDDVCNESEDEKVPTVQFLSRDAPLTEVESLCASLGIQYSVATQAGAEVRSFSIGDQIPEHDAWLAMLSGPHASWLSVILRKTSVVQGRNYLDNRIKRTFTPRAGQTVEVSLNCTTLEPPSLQLRGAARSYGRHNPTFVAVHMSKEPTSKLIKVIINEELRGEAVPLVLEYEYRPDQPFAPIHEILDGRNERIRGFYSQLWLGSADAWKAGAEIGEVEGPVKIFDDAAIKQTLDSAAIKRFCQIVIESPCAASHRQEACTR
ncbi:hypothetical protein V8E36_004188 [Tilletia maclaganii]